MFTSDNLNSFTAVALKKYCNDNDLKSSGHKGELIQRVKTHIEKKEQNEQTFAKKNSPFNPHPASIKSNRVSYSQSPKLTQEEINKHYNNMFNHPPR